MVARDGVAMTPDPRSGLDTEGRWAPAFAGQRPPFEPGHALSTRHGAYAVLTLRDRAGEVAESLRAIVPAFSPADEPAVRLLAVC